MLFQSYEQKQGDTKERSGLFMDKAKVISSHLHVCENRKDWFMMS